MTPAIAIVGMASRYPDARSPSELWENVLARRRAFRRIPAERLRLEDYLSTDRGAADRTYAGEAAVIEGYEFDRVRFRVAGGTFRSADLAHWLALDVASQALADAGFPEGDGLPRDATGVLLGNTLTGEFSRAHLMRLRWPYVRRVLEAALHQEGWAPERRQAFLERLEPQYKAPFPPVGEETLAGGLSNTIAGRICNHFDLKGGGYTVDGACAASLLAVTTASSALVAGDLDVALAGGVDLSLDPFELVGFAKAGALAPEEMRVYDVRSAGFWPGEGCGFVVLMRHEDAVAQGRRVYAVIRGWGVSSDGSGGITRPEVEGQLLALRRAYARAGFGIETVAYFEGHGTGTAVGDATELEVLSRARREAGRPAAPAAIGSIKANIGHTKAAAGVAGLLKAAMALHQRILPPTTGCAEPHPVLGGKDPALRILDEGEPWPPDRPLRAGVSAMGFGGINTHVVLVEPAPHRPRALTSRERELLASAQDAELFLLGAAGPDDLRQQVEHLLTFAARLARAELADLAAALERRLGHIHVRASVVASSPAELAGGLEMLRACLAEGIGMRLDIRASVFLGAGSAAPLIGFLFPGQGSPLHIGGGAWRRRFECVRDLYTHAGDASDGNGTGTAIAQPAIATASLTALRVLEQLEVTGCVAVGHSLGELVALHWADAIDEASLLRIVTARGAAMAALGDPTGAMASIGAGPIEVKGLLNGTPVVIAGLNSPRQTVVSGHAAAVAAVVSRARQKGLSAVNLPVSHAFHSPLVAAAAPALAACLARERFRPPRPAIVSTITGARLAPDEDLPALLARQVTSPVRFAEAVSLAAEDTELFIEVGPGNVLSGLIGECIETPVVPLDAGGASLKGLFQAVGAAFALGAPINHEALFARRFTRPFNLDWSPRFFANPCELAPLLDAEGRGGDAARGRRGEGAPEDDPQPTEPITHAALRHTAGEQVRSPHSDSAMDVVRMLVAERAELPAAAVSEGHRLLSDLHLNSIAVGQIVAEAARRLGLPPPLAPTEFADAKVAEVAQALEELVRTGGFGPTEAAERLPSGVDAWVRAFTVDLVERPLPLRPPAAVAAGHGPWHVINPPGHPLGDPLREVFANAGGGGVVVCLPSEPDERCLGLLLEGARMVLPSAGEATAGGTRFVLVQHGGGGAAFARTLCLEAPEVITCVVDVPPDHPHAAEWVLAEAMAATDYTEAHYDATGRRREPILRLLPMREGPADLPLGPADVLLVTGGGKGIAAECALELARETGVRLALLGRSRPETDAELAANLERIAAAGISCRYMVADVTDAEAVRAAVGKAEATLGPVTAVLHGAGANVPQLLRSLDEAAFRRTLLPKVQGARNILAAVDPDRLRMFVAFGSIIARTGMRGEADYAVANEWLARLVERWQAEHPHCRCLTVEWSVWAGVGMGERLGRVEALAREGITPIPPDQGIAILGRLLSQSLPSSSVVVTGRFGDPPTLRMQQAQLPFLRFLERPRVYYPGVELIVDADLSGDADPYLGDHVLGGERLLPAVIGLEAMAQVAMGLVGAAEPPIFEDVKLTRPVAVPEGRTIAIRLAALVRAQDRVEVVLRCEHTGFQVDHFGATCLFHASPSSVPLLSPAGNGQAIPLISSPLEREAQYEGDALDPQRDLYGGILFHTGRFRRLRGYRTLAARECISDISRDGALPWFSHYLPATLVLGDPGARDAAIHAVQACIPHARVLPIGVDRVLPAPPAPPDPCFVCARERSQEGDTFTYDLAIVGSDGAVRERWEGLRLRRVEDLPTDREWPPPLLCPYLERRIRELIPSAELSVVMKAERESPCDRRARTDDAIGQALGVPGTIWRRPDGKPEVAGPRNVSAAHAGPFTLAIAGHGPVGCDIEPIVPRPDSAWADLLGPDRLRLARLIAREAGEDEQAAATRVWCAGECLKKAGAPTEAPLTLAACTADGWVLLAAGALLTATFAAQLRGGEHRCVLAILARSGEAPCEPTSTGTWSASRRRTSLGTSIT